jgi:hypothetical protein
MLEYIKLTPRPRKPRPPKPQREKPEILDAHWPHIRRAPAPLRQKIEQIVTLSSHAQIIT